MKILFIDIPVGTLQTNAFASYLNDALSMRNDKIVRECLVDKHGVNMPGTKTYSLGVLCIATALKKRGENVTYTLADDENKILNLISEANNYDAILFSAKTTTYPKCLEVAEKCKKVNNKTKIIFGGPHCTALPEKVVIEPSIDFVCLGEGEDTICELIASIENNQDFSRIKGIAYIDDAGSAIITGKRPLCRDLNAFPDPDFELLEGEVGEYHIYIETGRGCLHNCSFCANPTLWDRQVRRVNPKRTYDKLKELSEKLPPNTLVHIVDPAFGIDISDLELCKLLIDNPLPLKFSCDICAMNVEEELVRLLYDAGFVMFCVGIENCENNILQKNKKPATFEIIRKACRIIRESCDALIKTYWIIGLPGETEVSARNNRNTIIDMLRNKEFDICCEHIFVPYPGCEVFADPKKYNYHICHYDWERYDARTFPLPGESNTFSMENAYISYLDLLRAECEVLGLNQYYDRDKLLKQQDTVGFLEHKKRFV